MVSDSRTGTRFATDTLHVTQENGTSIIIMNEEESCPNQEKDKKDNGKQVKQQERHAGMIIGLGKEEDKYSSALPWSGTSDSHWEQTAMQRKRETKKEEERKARRKNQKSKRYLDVTWKKKGRTKAEEEIQRELNAVWSLYCVGREDGIMGNEETGKKKEQTTKQGMSVVEVMMMVRDIGESAKIQLIRSRMHQKDIRHDHDWDGPITN
ncbi:hypothetical protein K439DRAFT_1621605 [Ramaria rubella]|nr:hypothetical protein K439DRAFT_1621605 [Ramaria rubella]